MPDLTEICTQKPLVSVVIPAFNARDTIQSALKSVLKQSYKPLEIIVVDDGSTDGTLDVLATFGSAIRVVQQSNKGLACARNAGIALAQGDLIAIMDADDICETARLVCQVRVFSLLPDVVLCSSNFITFDELGIVALDGAKRYYSKIETAARGLRSLYPSERKLVFPLVDESLRDAEADVFFGNVKFAVACGNFIHPPTMMFPRMLYTLAGPFDEKLRNHADWEWIARAAHHGDFAHIDMPLLQYRKSNTQRSSPSRWRERAIDLVPIAELIQSAAPDPPANFAEEMRLNCNAFRIEAAHALSFTDKAAALKLLVAGATLSSIYNSDFWLIALKMLIPSGLRQLIGSFRN